MEKIHLIYGPKGCGKTKKLVQIANDSVKTAKGVLIYVDKDNSRLHDLAHAIKLVDTSEYGVSTEDNFVAFVKGMLAVNYDIEKIFFDGIIKIVNKSVEQLSYLFEQLASLSQSTNVEFVFTFSYDKKELPSFMKNYNTLFKF